MKRKAKMKKSKAMDFQCEGCGQGKIKDNIYKCVLCEDFSLCEMCFEGNKHNKHPFILS